MISVLHIGLPFVPPWLGLEEGEKIAARLAGIRREMELDFKRQIIEAARIEAPEAKLLEFDHAVPVPVLTGKAFEAH